MSAPQLGQPVTFTHSLRRRCVAGNRHLAPLRKVWVPRPAGVLTHSTKDALQGIVVGVRTLSNGDVAYSEDGTEYVQDEHLEAYLVAYDVRRKPVYVLPEHCTLTTREG